MKKIIWYFSITLFIFSFLLLAKVIFNDSFPDFRSYYFNPLLSFNGINPYLANKNLFTPSTYPPFAFPLLAPLLVFPFIAAEKIWIILSIAALLSSLYLIFKLLTKKIITSENLILSSIVFLAFPTKFTLGMGQINLFIFLFLTLFIYFLSRSKIKSSIFLGLALTLKIFPLFIPIYLIIKKQWKILFLTICFLFAALILSLIFIKPFINLYFYQNIFPTLIDSWKGDYYNQSLSGVIVRAGFDESIRSNLKIIISLILFLFGFIPILINKQKDKLSLSLEIGIVITVNLLLNSFSWQHHFVWIFLPLLTTYFYLKKRNLLRLMPVLGLSYILVSLNMKNSQDIPVFLQSHVFYGALLLLFLEIYLLIFQSKMQNK